MGKRGPGSGGKMRVVEPIKKRFPNPQPGMTENARTVWRRIVKSFRADHFKPYQYDLLRAYCEASATHKKAIKEIGKTGEVIQQENGVIKENPWVNIGIKASNTMSQLSTKLALNANSALVARGKIGGLEKPKDMRDELLFGGKKK